MALIGNERPIRIVGGHLLQMKVGTNWNWGWALIGNKGGNQLKFWWALIGNVRRNYSKPSNVGTQNNEHISRLNFMLSQYFGNDCGWALIGNVCVSLAGYHDGRFPVAKRISCSPGAVAVGQGACAANCAR